jgi:glycosyltransferase involved in cell wall biosynthesis
MDNFDWHGFFETVFARGRLVAEPSMWSQSNPFSIVLCTCNGERFIERQLSSLQEQEGVAQIVISDDHSTDGTLAILLRHADEDPRILLHRNQTRLGVTANFQHAINLAKSRWVALADQDDVWLPGKLSRMRACWDGDSILMHHASRKFRGVTAPRLSSVHAGETRKFHGRDWRRLLHRNTVVGHTTLVRTDLARQLMPFPKALPHDWWLGVGAGIRGSVQFLDEYLVLYRIHDANAYHSTGSRCQRIREEYLLRLGMLETLTGCPDLPLRTVDREFAAEYLRLLRTSSAGTLYWSLWRFYLRHAGLFFSGPAFSVSWFTRWRKSITATGAAFIRPATSANFRV